MRPRSREVPVSSTSRGQEADEAAGAPVGTRDPRRSFADENERAGPARKIQDPKKLVLKVREVLVLEIVVLAVALRRRVRERRLHF